MIQISILTMYKCIFVFSMCYIILFQTSSYSLEIENRIANFLWKVLDDNFLPTLGRR